MQDTCASVMIPNPQILRSDITLGEAVAKLREVGSRYLPVLDSNDNFIGGFSTMKVIELLLPQSVSIKAGKNPFELSFMRTTLEELQERLAERSQEPIAEFILKDKLQICTPETSLMEVLNLLYKFHYHVVVCAPNSRKFLGVVSVAGVLAHIAG